MLAEDIRDKTQVCVKINKDLDVHNQGKWAKLRFNDEVKALDLKLDHPNVYKILDYGRTQMQKEGAPFGNEVSFIVTQLAANGNLIDYY